MKCIVNGAKTALHLTSSDTDNIQDDRLSRWCLKNHLKVAPFILAVGTAPMKSQRWERKEGWPNELRKGPAKGKEGRCERIGWKGRLWGLILKVSYANLSHLKFNLRACESIEEFSPTDTVYIAFYRSCSSSCGQMSWRETKLEAGRPVRRLLRAFAWGMVVKAKRQVKERPDRWWLAGSGRMGVRKDSLYHGLIGEWGDVGIPAMEMRDHWRACWMPGSL